MFDTCLVSTCHWTDVSDWSGLLLSDWGWWLDSDERLGDDEEEEVEGWHWLSSPSSTGAASPTSPVTSPAASWWPPSSAAAASPDICWTSSELSAAPRSPESEAEDGAASLSLKVRNTLKLWHLAWKIKAEFCEMNEETHTIYINWRLFYQL